MVLKKRREGRGRRRRRRRRRRQEDVRRAKEESTGRNGIGKSNLVGCDKEWDEDPE